VEARFRIEAESDREPVVRDLDILGEEAIGRGRLVEGRGEQRVEYDSQPGRRRALERERVVLSKFVMRNPATSSMSPPFGAFGFTHWKCANPAGYLMSPNWA